ncbi:OLC1v1015214C1 [Oldenlandia corymbosa var. corymbosa]|uniref:OLC1v1015214C1 n=1 Tax=Oldenlandia corymbosa var. corymbosa TaxID=529605 RepID=A0AAV1E6A7_OLDCO|nr:OLC1v1015214C2 [Oldenlandia corymbosa var. corymbosa]CAI9114483.1 OLC1v1015214C1 [Oldenlandia corymbosa var. corymbosa]
MLCHPYTYAYNICTCLSKEKRGKKKDQKMGCAASVSMSVKKKKKNIPQVFFFVPPIRVPGESNLMRSLKGMIPQDLSHKMTQLRSQIMFVAQDTGGSAIEELQKALDEYLPLLIGLTKKEYGLQEVVEFSWKSLDGKQETCIANSCFELLSVLHMMALLTLMEASLKLMPKNSSSSGSGEMVVSPDGMSEAVDLLLKAAGYLDFCIQDVLGRLPPDIKDMLPEDLQEGVMEALLNQALALGTEIQLGLAIGSQNATLSVKRRLACEQLAYYGQAHHCLSKGMNKYEDKKKLLLFIKWKYLQAKAAAYYYHGLMLDKGTEPSSHVSALSCFLAAEELVAESKKACLSFGLADPITRAPPLWGVMKHLDKKIPETASKKFQMHGYLLDQEKGLRILPDLPEFQLSLKPDDYELPDLNPAWDRENWETIPGQRLKEHLEDSEDETKPAAK